MDETEKKEALLNLSEIEKRMKKCRMQGEISHLIYMGGLLCLGISGLYWIWDEFPLGFIALVTLITIMASTTLILSGALQVISLLEKWLLTSEIKDNMGPINDEQSDEQPEGK